MTLYSAYLRAYFHLRMGFFLLDRSLRLYVQFLRSKDASRYYKI